jgi:Plavaka transposase
MDNMNELAGHDESGYISSEHMVVNNNTSQTPEVEDEDIPGRYAEDYNPADVAHILRKTQTAFETLEEFQNNAGLGENPWAPFEDEEEWELARFLIKEVSQKAADKYLKLPIVSEGLLALIILTYHCTLMRQTKNRTHPSYSSNYTLLKKIDSLPTQPQWKCELIEVTGNVIGTDGKAATESVELWFRDPVECVQGLIGDPKFRENLSYVPQRVFTCESGMIRIYDEAWTGDWWWTTQVSM